MQCPLVSSDEIVAWLKKKTGPAVTIIQSAAQAEELLESETPIAVAYLKSVEVHLQIAKSYLY